jgi:exonuclease SbcC
VIPVELDLANFLAYRDPGPLSFEGIHIACLAGPNGAGKSSLLDAMTWALWGKARSDSPDDLIYQGQTDMRVALTFDQEGGRFRVIRQRKGGKRGVSLLEFQAWDMVSASWRGLSEGSLRATQERIDQLLRLDYETFVNSAFLIQGRADEFTKKTPARRKQVLADILGLGRWETYEEKAKDRAAQTKAETQRLEGRLEEIDRELSQRKAHEAELEAAVVAAQRVADTVTGAEQRWVNLEQVRNQIVVVQRQIDDLTRRIRGGEAEVAEAERERESARTRADRQALQAALAEVQGVLAELAGVQERTEAGGRQAIILAEEAAGLRGVNQSLTPETEPIKTRAAVLESASEPICPTCGQPLTEEHRSRLLAELRVEIDQRRETYRANQARIKGIEAQAAALDRELGELNARLRERPGLEKRLGELSLAVEHAADAARQVEALGKKVARWEKDLETDRHKRDELEQQATVSEETLRAAAIKQTDLDRLRLEKRLADERVGGARQTLAALDSLEQQRRELLRDHQGLIESLAQYEDLRQAFGKRGVPAMIIETVVPELETSANELLGRMTDGRLHVRIETQKEIRTGELREALDIIISDELGSRSYELYSGGESFRINFAIRIALSRLLARRAGAQLRSLFIDEGFGTQDASGREHLISAINSIQDDFDRILVITHIDELKEAFPARIEVRKTASGSMFSLA